ncbi:hypothetical protein [Paractinoplanes durhamensis]|uniref:Uncharacterized protein n=1 Tax=Paractinoplanes durhamensis TaxID=113563 RepID=A0ABQ3ZCA1_9ACTN|nr:hypothetical protein [Actinoplanes durhamensis]GIE07432.1 hypothetical protein Adu01nite_87820 [Actinoplanes durhamensis]
MRRRTASLLLLALVAGCSSPPSPAPTPAPTTPQSCPATADLPADAERQGVGDGVTLWALFFGNRVTAGREMKIVWRMTGAGNLTMTATGPDGSTVSPSWGPEPHGGSSYNRPGEEWGTGWVFPVAGCWTISASRSPGQAHLTLRVA